MSVSKKNILITGCSSGIGLYCAKALQQRGHCVIASARKQADIETLRAQGLFSLQLDLDDSDSIRKALTKTLEYTDGKLDVLFNNGAYGQPGATEDLRREVIRRQFETNVFGTMELTNQVIPIMRAQGQGRIVFNSSVLGFVSMRFRGAYNASKYALEGFADTLRLELVGSGIDISLIEPGPITSRFRENAYQHFLANIDRQNSVFTQQYQQMSVKFKTKGPVVPFTLTEDAVYQKLLHVVESKHPKVRYFVTFPTWLFAFLKRLLPARMLDKILVKV